MYGLMLIILLFSLTSSFFHVILIVFENNIRQSHVTKVSYLRIRMPNSLENFRKHQKLNFVFCFFFFFQNRVNSKCIPSQTASGKSSEIALNNLSHAISHIFKRKNFTLKHSCQLLHQRAWTLGLSLAAPSYSK